MKKYRRKPAVIEAVQWNGHNFDECMDFMGEDCGNKVTYEDYEEQCISCGKITIHKIDRDITASKGDYIVKAVNGEFYPFKSDIFNKMYEEID